MTAELIRDLLAGGAVFYIGRLAWWFSFFTLAHDWMFRLHGRWFKLSVERFDAFHRAGMAFFKNCIWLFSIVPYRALRIVG